MEKKNIANYSNHGRVNLIFSAALSAILSIGLISCSNDEEGINKQVTNENVVDDDASAISLVNGIYTGFTEKLYSAVLVSVIYHRTVITAEDN